MEQQTLPMAKRHIRESGSVLAMRIILAIFVVDIFYMIINVFFFGNLAPFASTTTFSLLFVLTIIKLVVQSLAIVAIVLITLSREYFITDKQLILRRGVFDKDEKVYELIHVKTVKRHDTFLGKIIGYGNLIIMFAQSGFNEEVKLSNIRNPKRYAHVFMECMRQEKTT